MIYVPINIGVARFCVQGVGKTKKLKKIKYSTIDSYNLFYCYSNRLDLNKKSKNYYQAKKN